MKPRHTRGSLMGNGEVGRRSEEGGVVWCGGGGSEPVKGGRCNPTCAFFNLVPPPTPPPPLHVWLSVIKQLWRQNYFNYHGRDLGIVPGIRFSSLSAPTCLAAGSISSDLHLDSDILMMNYGLLSLRECRLYRGSPPPPPTTELSGPLSSLTGEVLEMGLR